MLTMPCDENVDDFDVDDVVVMKGVMGVLVVVVVGVLAVVTER